MKTIKEMPLPARQTDQKAIFLPSRPRGVIVCPKCWTAQRSERDRCYHCGLAFYYLDEKQENA